MSIGSGLLNEIKEFVEFGLYTWVPKRAALKLNSAFNVIFTAASKEVGCTRNTSVRAIPVRRPSMKMVTKTISGKRSSCMAAIRVLSSWK